MFGAKLRRRIAPLAFRGAALLALAGFVASVIGVPLPVVAPGKEASRQAARTPRGCCCRKAGEGTRQCCGHCGCSKAKPAAATAVAEPQVDYVLSILARKCQGQAEIWLALGALSPPPQQIHLTHELPCCGQLVSSEIALDGLTLDPATPPPRA